MSLSITLPGFIHQEVSVFYEYDLSIPKEKVISILELPRASLIKDMELMLRDTIERDEFFRNYPDKDKWWEFHRHALWVLVELHAEEALPTILELLKQDDDFSNFWFGDFSTENFWEILYHLGGNRLDELKKLCVEPGAWVNRIVPPATLEQIALHQPERRPEVIRWFRSVLEEFLILEKNDPSLDLDLISSILCDVVSIQAVELLPLIKKLYDQGLVFNGIVGDYATVERDINNPRYTMKRKVSTSIFDHYQETMTWHSYRMRYDHDYRQKHTYIDKPKETIENVLPPISKPVTVRRSAKKIGRNEPCPCGSGKKYKKCCLKK